MRMTKRAMRTLRPSAHKWMTDEIEIWRPSSSIHDDETLLETHVPGVKVWEGPARIRPSSGPNEQPISEGVAVMRDADVLIPISAFLPWTDDEVLAKVSEDPALEGRWFRITDVRVFSQQAARKFSVLQQQPSRDWKPA
jgi:hypothetical protein